MNAYRQNLVVAKLQILILAVQKLHQEINNYMGHHAEEKKKKNIHRAGENEYLGQLKNSSIPSHKDSNGGPISDRKLSCHLLQSLATAHTSD